MEISSSSTEYVKVPVYAVVNGALVNPTSDVVKMAFPAHGVTPASGDYLSGSWETAMVNGIATYYARCLVGPAPGLVQLAIGLYDCWVKITDNPEVVTRHAGAITVY